MKSKKVLAVLLVVLVLGLLALSSASATGCPPPPTKPPKCVCMRTPGYWKNHPEAWPVDAITIGGVTYSKDMAIGIMNEPVGGDKFRTLFPALIAAELNVSECTPWCGRIYVAIDAARDWVADNAGSRPVKANSPAWQGKESGEYWYEKLDSYNNGFECEPACD